MDPLDKKFDRLTKDLVLQIFLLLLVLCMAAALYSFFSVLLTAESGINAHTFIHAMAGPFLFGLLGIFPAIGFFWRLFRKLGADQVVVWLRRFHQHEPSRFPLPKYLSILGANRFQVSTIQDSKFNFSLLTGATRSILGLAALQVPLTFVYLLIAIVITDRFFDWLQPERAPFGLLENVVIVLMVPLVGIVLYGPIAYWIVRRRGAVRLKTAKDLVRIEKWIDRVHSGIGHTMPGLKIFKCDDDFWMDAVRTMLSRSDAAILDISDLNENMRWELGQCADLIQKDKLILAFAVRPEFYPGDPEEELVAQIEQLIGTAKLQEVLFWGYPEPLELINGKPKIDEELEEIVNESLAIALGIALDGEQYEPPKDQ